MGTGGLIVFGLSFLVRAPRLRRICLVLAAVTTSLPLLMSASLAVHDELRRRELDREMRQILRKRGLPEPPKR